MQVERDLANEILLENAEFRTRTVEGVDDELVHRTRSGQLGQEMLLVMPVQK